MQLNGFAVPRAVQHSVTEGVIAAALSTAALVWRGIADNRSAAAPINAISHWFWPEEALRRDDATMKYTATGTAVHLASSLLWSALYGWLRARRRQPTPVNAITDAALVTAMAAAVDLKVVPKRLSPGFEERLQQRSLTMVYVSFGIGLAIGGLMALRR